ncbi:MAG TPA: DUF1080 domain-containing protein [Pirellulaceae bacterium]|nr:DUF1080 domain-containing protein [Pirellulaceae bacterium]
MLRSVVLFSVVMALCGSATAAPKDKYPKAATSIAQADPDYAVQGEYVGGLSTDPEVGLQVVALGDGKFTAVLYRGGLPGAGWDRQNKVPFNGERRDGVVTLTSPQHQIVIQSNYVALSMLDGLMMGRLAKIVRSSPTMGLAPRADSTVLFDGTPHELLDAKVSQDRLLEIGATTKMPVGDFRLHLEFKTPYQPRDKGQGRGNSGVYIQRRYEVQILDSFGLNGEFNECGSLYRQTPPDLNMAYPPLVWQTYDIWFNAAKFDAEGKKIANARITLWHNGVAVHDNREIPTKTGAGQSETDKPLPIHFQNHGNPVQYRNMWIVLGTQLHPAEQPPVDLCDDCQPTCCSRGFLRRLWGR